MTRFWIMAAIIVPLAFSTFNRPAYSQEGQTTDEEVGKAIEKAKAYLWSKMNKSFVYDEKMEKDIPPWFELRSRYYGKGGGIQYGGWTAMAAYALLSAGEKYDDPADPDKRMKKIVEWLAKQNNSDGTYAIGARMQVWACLPPNAAIDIGGKKVDRAFLLSRDVKTLMLSMGRPGGTTEDNPLGGRIDPKRYNEYGMFDYCCDKQQPNPAEACHSNMHFGFLGIWAAARCGAEIPKEFWKLIYEHYLATQEENGAWNYRPKGEGNHTSAGMTAAGLANLLVANDYLNADKFMQCGNNSDMPAVVKAVKWLGENFSKSRYTFYYYHYCLERAGLGTGYKFLGDKDWYKLGVKNLLSQQKDDGSFTTYHASDMKDGGGDGHMDGVLRESGDNGEVVHYEVPTAFALLFLVRGRAPVLLNKLWYNGDWNNRPTAAANLAKFASKTLEAEINWQIVPIQTPTDAWHDSPVLLICGQKAPTFSDEEIAKLKTFIQQGGTIVSIVECNGAEFDKGMREAYTKMFPTLELTTIDKEHPLFTNAIFKVTNNQIKISELTNRIRPLAFHIESDIVAAWQSQSSVTQKKSYEIMLNVTYLISGGKTMRNRGVSPWPDKPATWPSKKIPLVRIKHSGPNYDPEPLAWERVKLLIGKEEKLTLDVAAEPVEFTKLAEAKPKIAVMTGTGKFKVTEEEKAALKKFVADGGILVIDPASTSQKFSDSARKMLEETFGADKLVATTLDKSPFNSLPKDFKPKYRRGSSRKSTTVDILTVEHNGKPAVFFFQDDITSGLLDLKTVGIQGLTPETSIELAKCIVNYAAGK